MFTALIAFTTMITTGGISGTVTGAHGEPLLMCYVAMYSPDWQRQLGEARTDKDGHFTLDAAPAESFLQVQPFRQPGAAQMLTYPWQPRVYALNKNDATLAIKTPPAVTYVIAAYGEDGKVMRWKDWEAAGKYGVRFLFATNPSLRAVPAQVYPVFGPLSGDESQGRGEGLPAVVVEPGQEIEIHALFWRTRGYGKLQISTPAPVLKSAGESVLVNWNLALAQDALARARANEFESKKDPGWFAKYLEELDLLQTQLPPPAQELATSEDAAMADEVLAKVLDLADHIAVARGKLRAELVRYGQSGLEDDAHLKLKRPAFQFGVYQGSPFHAANGKAYAAEPAYAAARDAGFGMATILPAWGWAGPFVNDPDALEQTFGAGALAKMGYSVKIHGICWLQDFMDILPPTMHGLPHPQIVTSAMNYQSSLLDVLGEKIDLWEALNEPATTNSENFTREEMLGLLKRTAAGLASRHKSALVNSPHEFNYGAKYEIYTLDGKPLFGYPDTFAAFLDEAGHAKALDKIGVIGLQVYPGFHLAGGTPGQPFEGPAWTPAYFERLLNTYAHFRKVIHVTEFSLPSSYGADWKAGYWKKPWDETTQADYAEAIYTIAYGHPNVQAIGWWDITDKKPSIETGGLLHADRTPKPVFERLANFISTAHLPRESDLGEGLSFPGGFYAQSNDADSATGEIAVIPGWRSERGPVVEVIRTAQPADSTQLPTK